MSEIKDKQLKIIKHYGEEKQLDQLVEECSELIKAICKYKRYGSTDSMHCTKYLYKMAEEIADVENLIEQLKYNSEECTQEFTEAIARYKQHKVNREIGRIARR